MDNRYHKYSCPALMSDGRFISSYVRSSTFDQYIRNVAEVNSATEYRHYLQNNGDNILNNLKSFNRQIGTCKVAGKCLPMSGSQIADMPSTKDPKQLWYEELLNEEPSQLDFMMTSKVVAANDKKKPCEACTR
jgi:hypothetical protein